MPTYTFVCSYCGREHDIIRKIDERNAPELCPNCSEVCYRKLAAPRGRVLGQDYNKKHDTVNRATAALLNIPYKELPKGLRTEIED